MRNPRLLVTLPVKLKKEVEKKSKKTNCSQSTVVKLALNEFFEKGD